MEFIAKPKPYWKQLIFVLTAGWIAIWIARTMLTPIYPQLSEFFGGVTKSQLGAISSFYFLGYVLMQIPAGLLVDKFGQKEVIIPGFIVFAVGVLLTGLSQNLTMMYIGCLLSGIGNGTYYGAAYSLTGQYVPKEQKSVATAIVNSGTAIGSGIGLVSASYFIAQLGIDWRYLVFITLGFILIVFAILIKKIQPKAQLNHSPLATQPNTSQSRLQQLFKAKMIGIYMVYFATCYAYYLITTWLPDFLSAERQIQGAFVGIFSSLVFFLGVPSALIFSRLADKFSHYKVTIIIGLECVAAILLIIAMSTTNNTLMIIALLMHGFFGKLAVEPIIISWLSDNAPQTGLGTTLGVFNTFGMASSIIVPALSGAIADSTGTVSYAFHLAAIIIFVGTAIFFITNRSASNLRK